METPKIIEYFRTVYVNAFHAFEIGPISNKYSLEATPTRETFSIWGIIYTLLFFIAFIPHDKNAGLYNESMRLNRDWIYAFTDKDFVKSAKILKELKKTMLELAEIAPCGFQQNSYDIYATWTIFASFLNTHLAKVYVYGESDNSLQEVRELVEELKNKKLRYFQKFTIDWATKGITKL